MKKTFILPAAAVVSLLFGACGQKAAQSGDSDSLSVVEEQTDSLKTLVGRWNIVNIAVNDTLNARPAELTPGEEQYIVFEADSTFGVKTNCNSLGGAYSIKADSISFGNMFASQMACDNMEVESILSAMLPEVRTYSLDNDTTLRLSTSKPASYIMLTKAKAEKEIKLP